MSDMALRGMRSKINFSPTIWEDESEEDEAFPIPSRKADVIPYRQHILGAGYGSMAEIKEAYRTPLQGSKNTEEEKDSHSASLDRIYVWVGYAVFVVLAVGIIASAIKPTPITKLGVPIGITLWAVLAYILKRSDKHDPAS